jgi:hypothetical protein
VAPGIVPDDAYLQVNRVGTNQVESVAIVRDRILTYRFRVGCLTVGRPLLYATGTHRIYGPVST